MSDKNGNNQSSTFKNIATQLDEQRQIYYAYAALDALSSSYSMFKYFYDVCIGGGSDDMHDFMLTPQGIAGIVIESFCLVSFSVLACHYDNKNKLKHKKMELSGEKKEGLDPYQKNIRDAGPYVRDVMKGLKNAYKGWRSVVATVNLLHVAQLNVLILPLGISLGVLGAINRCLIRQIRDGRKAMGDYNEFLRNDIKRWPFLGSDQEELKIIFDVKGGPPRQQEVSERYLGIVYSSFGGFVDALYLYAGALTLTTLAPHLLVVSTVICAIYTMACIVTRVDEEYKYQQKLLISYHKCWLSIRENQIQTLHRSLLKLEQEAEPTAQTIHAIKTKRAQLGVLIGQFDEHFKALQQHYKTDYSSALLLGIKNSLFAYSALSSILFLVSNLAALGGVVLPPLLVVSVVCSGLAFMMAFIGMAMASHYQYTQQKKNELGAYQNLLDLKDNLLDLQVQLLDKDGVNEALEQAGSLTSEPEVDFQNGFEVIRCVFSGLSKGQKFIDFSFNGWQERATDGHYHDTPVMFVLSVLSGLLFSLVLSLRAVARGFGKQPKIESRDVHKVDASHSIPSHRSFNSASSLDTIVPQEDAQSASQSLASLGLFRTFSESALSNDEAGISMDMTP